MLESGPHRLQRLVSKRLPAFQRKPVGTVFLKLFAGKGGYARLELLGQTDDHIDVAVPAEIGVVLVGALEEYFVLELRQPSVGVQRLSDRYVRLLEGRPSLVMAPPGERRFRYLVLV